MCADVEPLALSVCDGQHASIIAYGQTGSGKTYTMNGYGVEYGMSYRILNKIFEVLELRRSSKRWKTRKAQALARKEGYSDKGRAVGPAGSPGAGSEDRASEEMGSVERFDFSVSVSMLEIYNEAIRDLLLPAGAKRPALEARLNASGDVHVPHLSCVSVAGIDDVFSTFENGQSNRATAVTNLNEHSSRSHSLLIVNVDTYMVHESVGEGGSGADVGASAVGTAAAAAAADDDDAAAAAAATANDDPDSATSSSAHRTSGKLYLVDLAGRYMTCERSTTNHPPYHHITTNTHAHSPAIASCFAPHFFSYRRPSTAASAWPRVALKGQRCGRHRTSTGH